MGEESLEYERKDGHTLTVRWDVKGKSLEIEVETMYEHCDFTYFYIPVDELLNFLHEKTISRDLEKGE